MIRFFILIAAMALATALPGQAEENSQPDLAIAQWATTYNLSSRYQKFKAQQQQWLENPTPFFTANWENLGPNTMDTLSGRMICLTIDPSDPDRLYAGSGSGGLWRSENGGDSWEPLTDALPAPHISAVAVNPQNPSEILIGTGVGQVPTNTLASGIGVFRSTDGGMSWNETNFSFPATNQVSVYELVWDADLPEKVYLAATNGLYQSTDGGENWDNLIPSVRIYDVKLKPGAPQTIFVGVQNQGIRRSTNGGQSWQNLNSGIPFGNQVFRSEITICESEPDVMYASLISASGFGLLGLYRSNNGGNSWTNIAITPSFPCQPTSAANCTGWLFHTIAVAPDDPDIIIVGSVQCWRSTNGGQTWVWKDYVSNGSGGGNFGLTYVDNWDLNFHPTEAGTVYVCNDGGVQKSTDYGNTWIRKSNDLIVGQTYSIASRHNDPEFLIGGFHDHGLQRLIATDDNRTWTRWSLNDGIQTIIDPSNTNILYGNIQNGTPYKSVTMGNSHLNTFPITNGINEPGPWMTPLEMDHSRPNILYTSSNNILYRTTNSGGFWQTKLNVNTVRSIAVNQLRPDTVYAHAFNSTTWSLWRSHDTGNSWQEVNATNIPSWGVTNLESSPHAPNTLYAVRNSTFPNRDHVKVSYDNGQSWTDITNNLPDIMVWDILVSPLSADHLYLATELGVYLSEHAGQSWQPWNTNLPIIEAYDVDFCPADNTIRIGTMGRGVWKTAALEPGVSSTHELDRWAQQLQLQVYPNPVADELNLQLRTSGSGLWTVSLLNTTGQRLQSWEKDLPAGEQQLSFDVSVLSLSSGAYFLRLEHNGRAIHRKVILE